jgi:hypothetical protein
VLKIMMIVGMEKFTNGRKGVVGDNHKKGKE